MANAQPRDVVEDKLLALMAEEEAWENVLAGCVRHAKKACPAARAHLEHVRNRLARGRAGIEDPTPEPLWRPRPKPLPPVVAAPKEEKPMAMGSKGTGSSKLVDSASFHTLGGHRMFVYLETSKTAPYVVRVKHVDPDSGKARQGVVDVCSSEEHGRAAFEKRIKQAEDKGWRVGRPRREGQLTDIPDAPPATERATKAPKSRTR